MKRKDFKDLLKSIEEAREIHRVCKNCRWWIKGFSRNNDGYWRLDRCELLDIIKQENDSCKGWQQRKQP
jgi:hypothetical protein